MKLKNVILLESNDDVLSQLKGAIERSGNFHICYAGDNGDEGIVRVIHDKPDLVITDTFLKGADGFAVVQAVKKSWPSAKILMLGVANDSMIEKSLQVGAHYYLVKPFGTEVAMERIAELLQQESKREIREYAAKRRQPVTVEEKISDIFISIGIPPHIKGYTYLREAIKLTFERPHIINAVTKELYPTVANTYQTTASKVERAIRHAIEVAWNRGRIDAINAVFGARIYLGNEKPTNSEFIALVADKLILESMV